MKKAQEGFTIVTVIFIMVIVALVGSYVVSLSGLARAKNDMALQGVRAYYAAQSGIEWALKQTNTVTNGVYACPLSSTVASCPTGYTGTQTLLNLNQGGLNGFTVTVNCCQSTVQEGNVTYKVFLLNTIGTYGAIGSADYVSRKVYQMATDPTAP